MDKVDKSDPDDYEDALLLEDIEHLSINLLKLAYNGQCKKFMASSSVQFVIGETWSNAIIFTPYKKLFYEIKPWKGLKKTAVYLNYDNLI